VVERIALSPDGKILAVSQVEGGRIIVCLFAAGNGKLLRQIERKLDQEILQAAGKPGPRSHLEPAPQEIRFLAFTTDGRSVAAGTWDKTVTVWDVASGQRLRDFGGREQPATCFALSSDGKTLAAACSDGSLRGYDLVKGKDTFRIPLGAQFVRGLAY